MKVLPTLEGGLSVLPESDLEWEVLAMVGEDMDPPIELAEGLANLMEGSSEWDEWVVPELMEGFHEQKDYVSEAVKEGKQVGAVTVNIKNADKWYGALNQARLGLERLYEVSELRVRVEEGRMGEVLSADEVELDGVDEMEEGEETLEQEVLDEEGLSEEVVQAFYRDRFYASLQGLILEFVLDPEG